MVGLFATATKGIGASFGATMQSRLAQKVVGSVRTRTAEALLVGGTKLPPGLLAARLAVRMREIEAGVRDGFLAGLRAILMLIPLMVALVILSSRLSLATLAVLTPFALGTAMARKKWRALHGRALSLSEGVHQQVDELVTHMDVWRTYGAERRVCGALAALGERSADAAGRADGLRALLSGLNEFLAAAVLSVCIAVAPFFAPVADAKFVAFAAVFFMSYRPLRDLAEARGALERGALALSAVEQVAEVHEGADDQPALGRSMLTDVAPAQRAVVTAPLAQSVHWARDLLKVEQLEVSGPAVEEGGIGRLRPISFTARPGEVVAIIGATGSGKTTLLRALLGLEPFATGRIRYGEHELGGRGVGPLERPFAWVAQDAPVVAGTLLDNVLLARAGRVPVRSGVSISDSELALDLLDRIGAGRFGRECLDVQLGAAGRPVSGGERKWICLARALATGLPVLLLDEPTAGLDPAASRGVLDALDRVRGDRTIVLVTHQPEPLRIADRTIELRAGFARALPTV